MWKTIWTPVSDVRPDRRRAALTAEQYKPIYHWFSAHPAVKWLVVFLDRWLPLVPFVCYPVLLCLLNVRLSRLFLTQKQAALDFMVLIARSVFVPGLVFWGGTLLRSRLQLGQGGMDKADPLLLHMGFDGDRNFLALPPLDGDPGV